MTATLTAAETDLQVALRRLDQATETVAASKALRRNETERHAIISDLAAVWAALLTHAVNDARTGAP